MSCDILFRTTEGNDHKHTLRKYCYNTSLTSKFCILYIYATNIGTEYFKHGIYPPFFFSLQNAVCFIIIAYLVPVLFTFYIQDVLKLKKNNSGSKRLNGIVMFWVNVRFCGPSFSLFSLSLGYCH